jgi:hypothetical protein
MRYCLFLLIDVDPHRPVYRGLPLYPVSRQAGGLLAIAAVGEIVVLWLAVPTAVSTDLDEEVSDARHVGAGGKLRRQIRLRCCQRRVVGIDL